MEELKPCPFCGGQAELRIVGIGGYKTAYEVRCLNCGVGTDYDEDKQSVIDVWNTRSAPVTAE